MQSIRRNSLYVVLLLLLAACGQTSIPNTEGTLEPQVLPLNLVVNNVSDWPDANPGNGICASWIGNCTLRAAIEETNAYAGVDNITVPGGLYQLTNSYLAITDSVVIKGSRYGPTILDGQNKSVIFYINASAYAGEGQLRAELHFLTIRNGYSQTGGGIQNSGGRVLINKSTIMGNNAFSAGGGLSNGSSGHMELRYSTVSGNGNLDTVRAGGVVNHENSYMLIYKSSIHNNEGNRYGGIANEGNMDIVNSTISQNRSDIDTGGILNLETGRMALNNTTVAFNQGTISENGSATPTAAGLKNLGTVRIGNSIIANNINHFDVAQDCLGDLSSVGYNLIHDVAGCNVVGTLTGNLIGVDPLLKPLAFSNGSKTQTHALDAASLARNAGNPAVPNGVGTACEATDQRDKTRGFGPAGRCDMGAYEFKAAPSGGFAP
jgi:hypothetical protein